MMNKQDKLTIQAYLDDQLSDANRVEVEKRLSESEEWRRCRDALMLSKQISPKASDSVQLPDDVRQRLEQALQAEMEKPSSGKAPKRGALLLFRHPILSAAAMFILLLGLSFLFQQESNAISSKVSQDYKTCMNGKPYYTFTSENPTALQTYFQTMDMEFNPSFTNLSGFGFDFQGGFIKENTAEKTDDLLTLVFVNNREQMVTCQMFPGQLRDLAGTFTDRIQGGQNFRVAQEGIITMTFWQEGPMVCVISSCIDPEEAIRIAVGRATGMDL